MTDAEHITKLEEAVRRRDAALKSIWTVVCDAYLLQETPDEIKRKRAFIALDKYLRGEKILP
jgi:hypothetical protein